MTIYDKIREEKLKYDINREAAKISALSSRKIYSKKKTSWSFKRLTEEKELESIEALFPKNMRTDEIKKEINEIKKWADKVKRKDLKHRAAKYKNDFQHFKRQDLLVKVFILVKLVYWYGLNQSIRKYGKTE